MKVSAVGFLNAAPLWWGLREGSLPEGWELSFDTPSRCADRLASGEADLGLIPSAEFVRQEDLVLAAPLGVAALKEVTSVLLLCGGDLEAVETVHLDAASRTSQALVKHLLGLRLPRAPRYVEAASPPAALGPKEAALVIGDRALALPAGLKRAGRHDLAALWYEATGLPFVFAVWAGRREVCTPECRRALEASLAAGLGSVDAIAAEAGPRLGLTRDRVRQYLTVHLRYTLGGAEIEALRRFARSALGKELDDERLGAAFDPA